MALVQGMPATTWKLTEKFASAGRLKGSLPPPSGKTARLAAIQSMTATWKLRSRNILLNQELVWTVVATD